MASVIPAMTPYRTWKRDGFLISTDPNLIPITSLNAAFASDVVYWAKPLPEDVMRATLQNSLCFGLYEVGAGPGGCADGSGGVAPPPGNSDAGTGDLDSAATSGTPPDTLKFIGIARCITDFTTFVYLTDVYVSPLYQANGLGKWLIGCVQEVVESMPHLRRSMLFTSDWKRSVPFYKKIMGMSVLECTGTEDGGVGVAIMERKGPHHPLYQL